MADDPGLPEREAAVTRREAARREHFDPPRLEGRDGPPEEDCVGEAASSEGDDPGPMTLGDGDDHGDQGRMEAGRDQACFVALGDRGPQGWPPVEEVRVEVEGVRRRRAVGGCALLDVDGRVRLVLAVSAETEEAGEGVEEAADARGRRAQPRAGGDLKETMELRAQELWRRRKASADEEPDQRPETVAGGRVPAGEGEGAERGEASRSLGIDREEFAAPHASILAHSGAVPGDTERPFAAVLGERGRDVSVVVKDPLDPRSRLAAGPDSADRVGVGVAGEDLGRPADHAAEIGLRLVHGRARRGVAEVADMGPGERLPCGCEHGRRLEITAQREDRRLACRRRKEGGREAAAEAEGPRLASDELDYGVVATAEDRSVVEEERVDDRAELGPIVDALLLHDRPILRRCDDSVVQLVAGQARTLRLGRGLAPAFFTAPACEATILALGGDLQAAPVLAAAGQALAWPHVGDLRDPATRSAMHEAQADLCRMVGRPPEVLACDAHPDSISAVWARGEPGSRVERVFHHHAHVAATLAEHGREGALGVAWDGAGMGEDRSVWGGEFLAVDPQGSRRLASLRPFALPGGDAAARDGLRPLVGLLVGAGLPPPPELLSAELHRLFQVAARPRLSPPTSSVGRLFDAFACLLGLRRHSEYQAHAAIDVEQRAAAYGPAPAYPFDLDAHLLDWRPALRAAIAERDEAGLVAARLHATLIAMIVAVAERHRARVVALAGGCFANTILLGGAVAALEARGVEVLAPSRLPPGDGGLALGQAWVVGHRLRAEVRPCA